jgi:hypothetical protein
MADTVKISELPLATALTGAEFVPIVQDGETVRATAAQLLPVPVNKFVFNTANDTAPAEGEMMWNATDKTVDIGLPGGVTLQLGQEMHMLIKASATITNGQCIMATGSDGNSGRITAAPANGTGAVDGIFVIGVATQDIANNQTGFVTTFGTVRQVNTTGASVGETWAAGDVLYPHPTIVGGLTKGTRELEIPIALVLFAGNNGSLFVRR